MAGLFHVSDIMTLRMPLLCVLLLGLTGCVSGEKPSDSAALLNVAEQGGVESVLALVESGVPVDTRDECRFTPLMKASLNGHVEVVKRLLLFGASVDAEDKSGYTALLLAAQNGHREVVHALLMAGANVAHVEHSNGWDAMIVAARRGDNELVNLLLEWGATSAHKDKQGLTALHWAARSHHESTAELLIKNLKSETI